MRAKGYKVSPLQTAQNWEHKNGYELKRIFNIKDQTTWNILYKNFFLRKYFLLTHKAFYGKNFIFQPEATSQNHKFYYGTWQSEMYFKDISKEIIETFQFNKDLISTYTLSILEKMKNHVTVGLHVRRGDYLNKAFIDGFGKCCNLQYYQNAIQIITTQVKNPLFLIFSDDILWCKENIKVKQCLYIDKNIGENSWQDMYLMSKCSHNIIANSTFSWWGAWLNTNKNKLVIAPKHWWSTIENDDVVPKDWIRI